MLIFLIIILLRDKSRVYSFAGSYCCLKVFSFFHFSNLLRLHLIYHGLWICPKFDSCLYKLMFFSFSYFIDYITRFHFSHSPRINTSLLCTHSDLHYNASRVHSIHTHTHLPLLLHLIRNVYLSTWME